MLVIVLKFQFLPLLLHSVFKNGGEDETLLFISGFDACSDERDGAEQVGAYGKD
jgi:hypothetical protein